jgi:hypothetical protein
MCGGKETRDSGGQPNAGEEKQEMKEDRKTRDVGRQPGVMEKRDENCEESPMCE